MFSLKQIITKFYRNYEHNCGNEHVHLGKDRGKYGKLLELLYSGTYNPQIVPLWQF